MHIIDKMIVFSKVLNLALLSIDKYSFLNRYFQLGLVQPFYSFISSYFLVNPHEISY